MFMVTIFFLFLKYFFFWFNRITAINILKYFSDKKFNEE